MSFRRPHRPVVAPENLKDIVDGIFHAAAADGRIEGGEGNDTVIGTDGPDYMCGYGGNDVVKGGAGCDYIEGCLGDDELWGGSGRDVFLFYTPGHDTIMDWQRGDYMELMFLADDISQVHIERISRTESIMTIDGHPEVSVTVLGRGFGFEDIQVT